MEIARDRNPVPAEPSATPPLPSRDDPQRAALALLEDAPARLLIRRIQFVESGEAYAFGARLVSESESLPRDQNSDFAAAPAALISGAG